LCIFFVRNLICQYNFCQVRKILTECKTLACWEFVLKISDISRPKNCNFSNRTSNFSNYSWKITFIKARFHKLCTISVCSLCFAAAEPSKLKIWILAKDKVSLKCAARIFLLHFGFLLVFYPNFPVFTSSWKVCTCAQILFEPERRPNSRVQIFPTEYLGTYAL
jgi:hypothetical protein